MVLLFYNNHTTIFFLLAWFLFPCFGKKYMILNMRQWKDKNQIGLKYFKPKIDLKTKIKTKNKKKKTMYPDCLIYIFSKAQGERSMSYEKSNELFLQALCIDLSGNFRIMNLKIPQLLFKLLLACVHPHLPSKYRNKRWWMYLDQSFIVKTVV